jgi:uncharacterized Zn-binding protein involved in type VI secretion
MPGNLLHVNATVNCPHGAKANIASTNQRVKVSGMAVATVSDITTVAGCPFQAPGPTPQPCVKVQWTTPATRVKVNGQFVLLSTSSGLCQSAAQIPQGAPIVATTQIRVKGM